MSSPNCNSSEMRPQDGPKSDECSLFLGKRKQYKKSPVPLILKLYIDTFSATDFIHDIFHTFRH